MLPRGQRRLEGSVPAASGRSTRSREIGSRSAQCRAEPSGSSSSPSSMSGCAGRRQSLRPAFRLGAGQLGRGRPARCASSRKRAVGRWRSSTTAISTPATTSSSPAYKLGNIRETHMIELISFAAQIKFGQDKRDTLPPTAGSAKCASPVTAMSQEPFHRHSRRRAGAQLPVRGLQGLLRPYRPADDADGGPAAPGPLCGRGDGRAGAGRGGGKVDE